MQPSSYNTIHVLSKQHFISSAYFIKIVNLNILEDVHVLNMRAQWNQCSDKINRQHMMHDVRKADRTK